MTRFNEKFLTKLPQLLIYTIPSSKSHLNSHWLINILFHYFLEEWKCPWNSPKYNHNIRTVGGTNFIRLSAHESATIIACEIYLGHTLWPNAFDAFFIHCPIWEKLHSIFEYRSKRLSAEWNLVIKWITVRGDAKKYIYNGCS